MLGANLLGANLSGASLRHHEVVVLTLPQGLVRYKLG